MTIDDVATTDAVFITLEDIGGQPGLAVTNLQQVFSQSALRAATAPSDFIDS